MLKFKLANGKSLDIIVHHSNMRYIAEQNNTRCFFNIDILSDAKYSNFSEISEFFSKNNIQIGETILSYQIVDQDDNVILSCEEVTLDSMSTQKSLEKNVIKVEFLRTYND